ncbi:MAG: serine hydrolase [bacterium]
MRFNLLLCTFMELISFRLAAQQQDIVAAQEITSRLHHENVGTIAFTATSIPMASLKQSDFLHSYALTNKSNLFITVFMGTSLTNYLHRVAPDLSADSLVEVGNYQFSLLVDNHLIYESNLLRGAPRAAVMNTETAITKPLIDSQHEGAWWTQSFWMRFMMHGGDSALTDGTHLLRMEIRPYVTLATETKVGDLIASGELRVNVKRKPNIDISKIRLRPVRPCSGLAVSADEFDEKRMRELIGNIHEGVFKNISSVVVIKNGKLLIEEYFNGETRKTLHDPRSVGKSFASTITGIAIGEGYLKSEDQTLGEFYDLKSFANYSPRKQEVSIKDLLTMSSVFDGFDEDGNSPGNEENMYPTPDWVKFTLDLPVSATRPKDEWHYFTAGVVVLGDILNRTVPGGLEKYADEKLFKPLHIKYQWQYTPQKVPNTAGGIRMSALDFAKYGQLYKNGGNWNGEQIIPRAWVDRTLTKHKTIPGRNDESYGYLFWNKKLRVNGRSYETFYCAGNGGNSIFIFKDQPLVVVITATAYGAMYAHPQVSRMMENYILPAVIDGDRPR